MWITCIRIRMIARSAPCVCIAMHDLCDSVRLRFGYKLTHASTRSIIQWLQVCEFAWHAHTTYVHREVPYHCSGITTFFVLQKDFGDFINTIGNYPRYRYPVPEYLVQLGLPTTRWPTSTIVSSIPGVLLLILALCTFTNQHTNYCSKCTWVGFLERFA
jgi:hypothetical protein